MISSTSFLIYKGRNSDATIRSIEILKQNTAPKWNGIKYKYIIDLESALAEPEFVHCLQVRLLQPAH